MIEILLLFFTVLILFAVILLLFGLIGPSWLRNLVRRFHTFFEKDAVILFPIDPYKPLPDAVKEGMENFWPTKERFRKFLLMVALFLSIAGIGVIITLGLIIIKYFL